MKSNTVLYIARAGLPMNAPGVRIFHMGALLEKNGYRVHYLSLQRSAAREEKSGYTKVTDGALPADEVHFQIDDKVYSYLPPFRGGKLAAVQDLWDLRFGGAAFKRVRRYCDREHPVAIFLYNDAYALTKRLIPYCKKRGIKLYADVTEWYEMDKDKDAISKMLVKLTDRRIRTLDHQLDGIVAISEYFYDFYTSKGATCVQIPPLMDIPERAEITRHIYDLQQPTVNFVYAGSPGGKDLLAPFMTALRRVNQNGLRARLDLVGLDRAYAQKLLKTEADPAAFGVFAHGRLAHEATVEVVKKADFGILFRRDLRYAKAGFSTKLAECMSLGVPMICNRIGGCDLSVTHGENGFLTDTYTTDEISTLLEHIVEMPLEEICRMKQKAYGYALAHFRVDDYQEILKKMMHMDA